MKVYNQEKTQELTDFDLEKGRLVESSIIRREPEVQEVKEQGHYETISEYPNGGRDVRWVVDVPGREYRPAKAAEEKIFVYIPYSERELQNKAYQMQIEELKAKLADTDYKAIKYAEGELTESEYAPIRLERRGYRAEINRIEMLIVR